MKPMSIDSGDAVAVLEARLGSRLSALGIKPGSKAGLKEEAAFLSGAAHALHLFYGDPEGKGRLSSAVPPLWIICPMSGRSVIVEREVMKRKEAA